MNYSKIWRIWKRHKPGESGESSWWCVWPKGRKRKGGLVHCVRSIIAHLIYIYIYIYSISIQFFIYVSSFVLSTPAFISDIMLWGQKYWGAGPVRHLRKWFFAVRKDWNAINIHIIHIIHIIHEHSWTFMNIHEHSWTFMNIMNIHEHSWTFMNIHEHHIFSKLLKGMRIPISSIIIGRSHQISPFWFYSPPSEPLGNN